MPPPSSVSATTALTRISLWLSVTLVSALWAWGAWERRWIADDGLIVLRTVRNLLAGNGPVFSAGHDFGDIDGADLAAMQQLVGTCSDVMLALRSIPQVAIARVHALATAAGCQLVAACDLAVAAQSAAFAVPGGKGGWFCTTPMVAVGRAVPLKRAVEMAFTGDPVDAATAADWGLINAAVPDNELVDATNALLARATRGSAASKAIGKQALYAQLDMPLTDAYRYATGVMADASQTPDAREGVRSFLDKRPARWDTPRT